MTDFLQSELPVVNFNHVAVEKRRGLKVLNSNAAVWHFLRIVDSEPNKVYCCYCDGFDFTWNKKRISTSNLRNDLIKNHAQHTKNILEQKVEIKSVRCQHKTKTVRENEKNEHFDLVDNKVVDFVINDVLPFSIVESKNFIGLLQSLDSKYKPPSRKRITEIIKDRKNNMKAKLKEILHQHIQVEGRHVSLVLDFWTDCVQHPFGALQLFFINDQWEMKHMLLDFSFFPEKHTSFTIESWITQNLADYNIPLHKVSGIVTDNASNLASIFSVQYSLYQIQHIRCVAHTLNLIVNKAIKDTKLVAQMITSIQAIVSSFRKSWKKTSNLELIQRSLNITAPLVLLPDVATRWSSKFIMIKRFLQLYPSLQNYNNIIGDNDSIVIPNADDCNVLSFVCNILENFYIAQISLEGENYVTISGVQGILKALEDSLSITNTLSDQNENNMLGSHSSNIIQSFRNNLKKHFQEYKSKYLSSPILDDAAYLDIQHKKLSHIEENMKEVVKSRIFELMKQHGLHQQESLNDSKVIESDTSKLDDNNQLINTSVTNIDNLQLTDQNDNEISEQIILPANQLNNKLVNKRKGYFNPALAAQKINNKKTKLSRNIINSHDPQTILFYELQKYNKEMEVKICDERSDNLLFGIDHLDVQYVNDFNILEWWKSKQSTYPTLANIARDILCIPATSASAERVFSISGRTVSKLRTRMKPKTIEDLMMNKCNHEYFI